MKKLALTIAVALLIPLLLQLVGGYGYVDSFPYGGIQHISVIVGAKLSIPLLLGGFFGFFLGMIHPPMMLWFGKVDRHNVAAIFISMFLGGLALQYEIRVLGRIPYEPDVSRIDDLYQELKAGLSTSEILKIRQNTGNLNYAFGSDSDYDRMDGFPYDGNSRPVINIALPGSGVENGVVVQMTANPRAEDARSERIVLVNNERVVAVSPPLMEGDPRLYWGTLDVKSDKQTFTPCVDTEMPLDTSDYEARKYNDEIERDFFTDYKVTPNDYLYRKTTAILVGFITTSPDGTRRFMILSIKYLSSADSFSSYTCNYL